MLHQTIIRRTARVPRAEAAPGDGAPVARQMDAVLVGAGFKASRELLEHLSGLEPGAAMAVAERVVGAARAMVGDDVTHNSYFLRFPEGVPDTVEFWARCLHEALVAPRRGRKVRLPALTGGWLNLLDLPAYGRYQHTYAELLAAHDELIGSVKDRVTVLHLGATLAEETSALYRELAASPTPLGEADLELLAELALACVDEAQPEQIPVRENRAVVNSVRLAEARALIPVDTVTDVLRLACRLSGGDVTLATPTRFRSFTRRERRALLGALDQVVDGHRAKLGDVARFAGAWKRLGEGLHPHEYPRFPHAADVFAVARGERTVRTLAGRAEEAMRSGDVGKTARILTDAPGLLVRSLDRLLRTATPSEVDTVLDALESVIGSVSGRVLCSVREHLLNRSTVDPARVFTNRARRAWVAVDARMPVTGDVVERVNEIIDTELTARMPAYGRLVVDPAVLDVALPLSGKASEDGFAVLPRGSRVRLDLGNDDVLRFFTYWRQRAERTDFDLSTLLLDENFEYDGHVSWTNHHFDGVVYSGDITEAADGATEFIDVSLRKIRARCVVPQVNVYSGEGFNDVAESMFGWMIRGRAQRGAPFEPRTVRTRSEMRGSGRVALPVAFLRDEAGVWSATWLHLYLSGTPRFNRVEYNQVSAGLLARSILQRRYLTVAYLVDLSRAKAAAVTPWQPGEELAEPVTYLGLDRPDGLPAGSTAITLDRLNQLIPR
ncbi:hypothetical protein SAMN05421504_104530 [Amycolatopsis xylanica]|uniref:TerD domain-containing protein n=1 Tax=Amycolatopsis xylanica TaxID=589385 RepID=A0A1H3H5S1_9PSEU|nr:TerD family protein [Amycolatopsis xylanica]SDY10862.1 hypothetical protein SAMN05421504_104530 [Amycolatopsis xylanica]